MRIFAIVPDTFTDWPDVECHWTPCPGDPTRLLVVVNCGHNYGAEARWRACNGVQMLPDHLVWYKPVPPIAVTLFGPWGVLPTDTIGEAVQKIRTAWPHLHP